MDTVWDAGGLRFYNTRRADAALPLGGHVEDLPSSTAPGACRDAPALVVSIVAGIGEEVFFRLFFIVFCSPARGEARLARTDPGMSMEFLRCRPMRDRNFALFPVENTLLPALKGFPRFDADGRTLRLACDLRPGVTYVLQFNSLEHPAFVDSEGHPLAPFVYRFTTSR